MPACSLETLLRWRQAQETEQASELALNAAWRLFFDGGGPEPSGADIGLAQRHRAEATGQFNEIFAGEVASHTPGRGRGV